jgi:subtilisin family serine protease
MRPWTCVATVVLLSPAWTGLADGAGRWWAFLDERPSERHRLAFQALGAQVRVESQWFRAFSLSADDAAVARIARLPFVRGVGPVARFTRVIAGGSAPSAPALSAGQAAVQQEQIRVDALHARGLLGLGVKVGVLDTGFELHHSALVSVHVGAVRDFVHGDDNVADDARQDDPGEAGHGTQTLSVLAANLPGVLVGVAPEATYYLAKTEDVTRNGRDFEARIEEDDWIAGLEWAVSQGCRVVNSSLGYSDWYDFAQLDGKTAMATRAAQEAARHGTLVVSAAGNSDGAPPRDNTLRGRVFPPADAEGVLAVGAALPDGTAARITGQGPTADGRIKPDVLAPGVGVPVVSAADDAALVLASGTSVAAPFATGVVALLLQAFPSAQPAELLVALRATASRADSPDTRNGYGLLNADQAFRHLAQHLTPTNLPSGPAGLLTTLGAVKQRALHR